MCLASGDVAGDGKGSPVSPGSAPPPLPPAVSADDPALRPEAQRLAAALGLALLEPGQPPPRLLLALTARRLELRDTTGDDGPVHADFLTGKAGFRRRHGGMRQPIARAVGLHRGPPPRVLDATPGLGRDAFVLACLGCRVHLVERSPVVAALLADAMQRAAADPEVAAILAAGMRLTTADACRFMADSTTEAERAEVVCLDPMYPHRDKSALVKKEMRRLRALVGDDDDAPALLAAALAHATRRVVVKRPRLAPPLAGKKPHWTIPGRTTRFDVYLTTRAVS